MRGPGTAEYCHFLWEGARLIEVIRSQLGTSQMLHHKCKIALPTFVGYSPVSPSGRMRSSPILISAPTPSGRPCKNTLGQGGPSCEKEALGSWCPSRLLPPFPHNTCTDFIEQRWLTSGVYVHRSECFSQPVWSGRKRHSFPAAPGCRAGFPLVVKGCVVFLLLLEGVISWSLSRVGWPCACGPVVRTEHEQREDLKNRMLKNMKAIRVWPLRIERDINFQSGEDLIWRYLSRLRSLTEGALWLW